MNKKIKKVLDFFKNMSYFICVNRNDIHIKIIILILRTKAFHFRCGRLFLQHYSSYYKKCVIKYMKFWNVPYLN